MSPRTPCPHVSARLPEPHALLSILLAIAVSELLIRGVDPKDAVPNVRERVTC